MVTDHSYLEYDTYFAGLGLPTAKRIWDVLLPVIEDMERSGQTAQDINGFVARVTISLTTRRSWEGSKIKEKYLKANTKRILASGPQSKRREVLHTDLGVLIHGCGVEWLEALAPGSIDLIVADPPYGIGKGPWDRFPTRSAYVEWSRRWISAAHRALVPNGTLYVMGFSEILAEVLAAVVGGWHSARWLVWYYRNKANLRDDWGRSHESAIHLRKSKRFKFNVDPVRIPYNEHTVRYPERTQAASSQYGKGKGGKWAPHPLGAKPRDVLEIPVLANGTPEKTEHPTQKPVELIRRLILASSDPGDVVADPFAGSGTTAVVSGALGRRWSTCETDESFLEVAKKRILDPGSFEGSQADEKATAGRRARLKGRKS